MVDRNIIIAFQYFDYEKVFYAQLLDKFINRELSAFSEDLAEKNQLLDTL